MNMKKSVFPFGYSWPNFLNPGEKVILGMSGGVDSAATAALLKQSGAEVIGVFLQMYEGLAADQALQDAKAVAQSLEIELRGVDCREIFKQKVMEPFVKTYCEGQTPLPCGLCNPQVKFSVLQQIADDEQIKWIATGHYAQIQMMDNVPVLGPASDSHQDQSYFLYGLSASQLERIIFPLGGATKAEVRAYAEKMNIPVFQKKGSQDICFLSQYHGNYAYFIKDFLQKHPSSAMNSALEPGDLINKSGEKLGRHPGIIHYTIGQRRGLGIASANPLYVFRIQNNQIWVGEKDDLAVQKMRLAEVHWHPISVKFLKKDQKNKIFCQFRSTMTAIPAFLNWQEDGVWITFETLQYGISPGQVCVIRNQDGFVLGGGNIAASSA